uniref:Phosphatidylinositol-glycan biosynthesis class X protein n=2 Tax=Kalanchoe fedtschenkoi TaxID=63787 RepID=A0A7N0UW35_KALFE
MGGVALFAWVRGQKSRRYLRGSPPVRLNFGAWGNRSAKMNGQFCLGMLLIFCSIAVAAAAEAESGGLEECVGALYFRKYDSVDDLHFETFVEQELSGSSCGALAGDLELMPVLSVSERYLIGEGSHRRLSTTIRLRFPLAKTQIGSCEVIFVERLPHGVFADPFELQHLQRRGVFKEASVFGDTNLELPSFLSNRSLVEVHMDVDIASLSNGMDIKLELPLHGRYQPLDDRGYTDVEFGAPDLFLRCKMHNQGGEGRSCLSILDEDGSSPRHERITWSLPSGIKAHTGIVSLVTFSSAILSTLSIVFASMRYPDLKKLS